jgi:hypothetical protein
MQSSFVMTMIVGACVGFAFSHAQAVGEGGVNDVSLLQFTLDMQEQDTQQSEFSADLDQSTQCTLIKGDSTNPILPEIFGMNQINGAIFTDADFDDEVLMEATRVLWSGQMRFPGGTVGNFWYMPEATYPAATCSIGGGDDGNGNSHGVSKDFCDDKERVDARGPFTFSTKKFVEGFGSSSPVNSPNGALYMLNVLQQTNAEIRRQIDHLHWVAQNTSTPVKYLEFGNELFLMTSQFYQSAIPNAETYWSKVTDGLAYAQEKLGPDVVRIVPFAYPFCQGDCSSTSRDGWNDALNARSDLFEAVSIHEYTGCRSSIDIIDDSERRIQSMLAWGDAALTRQKNCIANFDNLRNKPIWITEWSLANFAGVPLFGDSRGPDPAPNAFSDTYPTKYDVTASALSGIFKAAHFLKAIARSHESSNPVKAMHHQLLNDDSENGYGRGAGLTQIRPDGLYVSPAGQIVSHISWLALRQSQRYRRVTPQNCGGLGFEVNTQSGLGCLQAVAFEDPDRVMPFYAVINRCDDGIQMRIDTSALVGTSHLKLRKVTYSSSSSGDWVKVSNLSRYIHPWRDGPIPLSTDNGRLVYKRHPFNDQTTLQAWAKSLTIIDFIND